MHLEAREHDLGSRGGRRQQRGGKLSGDDQGRDAGTRTLPAAAVGAPLADVPQRLGDTAVQLTGRLLDLDEAQPIQGGSEAVGEWRGVVRRRWLL